MTAPSRRPEAQREKMRVYMAERRAATRKGRPALRRGPRRRRNVGTRPRPQEVHAPLPVSEQREGHCTFCGLKSLGDVCGFCQREVTGFIS